MLEQVIYARSVVTCSCMVGFVLGDYVRSRKCLKAVEKEHGEVIKELDKIEKSYLVSVEHRSKVVQEVYIQNSELMSVLRYIASKAGIYRNKPIKELFKEHEAIIAIKGQNWTEEEFELIRKQFNSLRESIGIKKDG